MANKIRAKLVMELLHKGVSVREIRETRHIAPASVKKVRDATAGKGLVWADVEQMGDKEVCDRLFPEQAEAESACMQPDYDYVRKELQRDGVTLLILYAELRDQAAEKGLARKSYGTFCRGYKEHVVARKVTNHLERKPGQAMEVDWNGTTMKILCEATGEVMTARLFVARLPYSQYSYVEATLDMKQNTWLMWALLNYLLLWHFQPLFQPRQHRSVTESCCPWRLTWSFPISR